MLNWKILMLIPLCFWLSISTARNSFFLFSMPFCHQMSSTAHQSGWLISEHFLVVKIGTANIPTQLCYVAPWKVSNSRAKSIIWMSLKAKNLLQMSKLIHIGAPNEFPGYSIFLSFEKPTTYCYQKQKGILPKTQIGLINQPWGKVAEQRSGLEAKSQGIKHASKAILFTAIPIGILHKKLPTIRIHTYIYSNIVPYRQSTQSFEAFAFIAIGVVLQYFHFIGELSLLYVTNLHGGSRDGYENWGWRGIFLAT